MSDVFSARDKRFLLKCAKKSVEHNNDLDFQLCAMLRLDGGKIYHGYNYKKSHPLQKEFSKNDHAIYLHAEIDAIRKARSNRESFKNSTLYIARVNNDGLANACPCTGCEEAIYNFGIGETYFTTSEGYGLIK